MRSRKLVQRSRPYEDSSPAPSRHNQRQSQVPARQREAAALPPNQAPSCPLSATARRELDDLRVRHDYSKYSRHLDIAKANLPVVIADTYDRLRARTEQAEKEAAKRQKDGSQEKTEAEIDAEERANALEVKITELTEKAEKAMRDIVDYKDELAMRDTIMKDVSLSIPPAPAPQPVRMRQRQADGEEDEASDGEAEVEGVLELSETSGVSTVELLKEANAEYARKYASKSMRERLV